jgi:RNase adaptor protein for sRNA GlmZ degradation
MISIESFGWRHPDALDIVKGDVLVYDLSEKLHDPNVAGSPLQHMTGLDDEVYQHVMNTAGARETFAHMTREVIVLHQDAGRDDIRVLIACRGGRHRSVVAAICIARWVELWTTIPVKVTHHHVMREVLPPVA